MPNFLYHDTSSVTPPAQPQANPPAPSNSEKAAERLVMAGEAALNIELGNIKVAAAEKLADTGNPVGEFLAAVTAVSASGNYAAAGVQATVGTAIGDTKDASNAAKVVTTVTSPSGFVAMLATGGNVDKSAKWAAREGIITASPKDIFHGSLVQVVAKAIDYYQSVKDAFSH